MATGMAIMGFGGGAMIGSPLAAELMKLFATPDNLGVAQTFVVMALVYFVFMIGGAMGYRVPPTGWKPAGWTAPAAQASNAMITQRHVHVKKVWGIPQFWLVWIVLCMNVSAGIGVIGMASPRLQEVFGGSLIGIPAKFGELDKTQLAAIAGVAAGFTALLSLVQHRRAFLLGQPVRQARPQGDLRGVLRARRPDVRQHPEQRGGRFPAAVRRRDLRGS